MESRTEFRRGGLDLIERKAPARRSPIRLLPCFRPRTGVSGNGRSDGDRLRRVSTADCGTLAPAAGGRYGIGTEGGLELVRHRGQAAILLAGLSEDRPPYDEFGSRGRGELDGNGPRDTVPRTRGAPPLHYTSRSGLSRSGSSRLEGRQDSLLFRVGSCHPTQQQLLAFRRLQHDVADLMWPVPAESLRASSVVVLATPGLGARACGSVSSIPPAWPNGPASSTRHKPTHRRTHGPGRRPLY